MISTSAGRAAELARERPVLGARPGAAGVEYRVWAPDHASAQVEIMRADSAEAERLPLTRDDRGYFTGLDAAGRAGDLYLFRLGRRAGLPDPASRFQPRGVQGPSQVIDGKSYAWTTTNWRRPPMRGRVIYELHIGAFTTEGTFRAAIEHLDDLVELGVNTLELMPLADFVGERNWGYDGVMLFAPARCYGTPDDLRALVDAAHARGLAVVLDVVYNHLGPTGNVLPTYSRQHLHPEKKSMWGATLNFDGEASGPVRDFFLRNAEMWLDDYRFDGLRLDSIHTIADESEMHLVAEITALAASRGAFVIAEDERNVARTIEERGSDGWGVNAVWADDFHHTVRVALTGQGESHFGSYQGSMEEWAATLQRGWLFHGQYFPHWRRSRGTDARHLPPERFVYAISNHDQVGNRPLGDRLHHVVSPDAYRAVSLLLCLVPYTPMIFMGQEWATSARFPFFTHQPGEVGRKMAEARLEELKRYGVEPPPEVVARMPDPQAETTFLEAKLPWSERHASPYREMLALYRAALGLRATHAIFRSAPRGHWRAQAIHNAFLGVRWFDVTGDWLLIVSVAPGAQFSFDGIPFHQCRVGYRWEPVLHSNEPRFGGPADAEDGDRWIAPFAGVWRETRMYC